MIDGHGGAMVSAIASQLEGPGFDSGQGRCGCWRRVPTSMSPVPTGLVVVGKRAFLCGVCMFSTCLLGFPLQGSFTKTCSNPGRYSASSGQSGRLIRGRGTSGDNVILPRATSYWGISPCQVIRSGLLTGHVSEEA